MSQKNTPKVKAAREAVTAYPDMPRLKLARILRKENPFLFKDAEDARTTLRYVAGKKGPRMAKEMGTMGNGFIEKEDRPRNPYHLPKSDETVYEPFILEGHKRIGILSDVHAPFQSNAALTAALDFLKKDKPDAIVWNGDIIDCFQLSRFVKDPRQRSFAEELKVMQEILQIFEKHLKCKMYFKYGNHSERYEHFLFTKAGELLGVEEFELDNIIKKRIPGIEIIKDKRIIKANGLNIIHGHEFNSGFFSPVNVARGLFLRGKTSALQGHSHQTSSHTESDMNGKVTTTWSTGALCELHPKYAVLNKWNHGFAVVDLGNKDEFDVRNYRIIKGRVII